MLVTLFNFLLAATAVSCTINVANPIDNQLPRIARIGQPYTWTFSSTSFSSDTNTTLSYTASNLPDWLSFNNATRTFHGTPAAEDEGTPQLSVTASDSSSSATSDFSICITHFPPPTLQLPIEQQFYAGNPSLSSVFFLAQDSALETPYPTLRIPVSWSFSVGFQGDMYMSDNDLYYDALLLDGSPLPDWVKFNSDAITFDGVVPPEGTLMTPYTLSIGLHASDQQGYTADVLPFGLVIADHELSSVSSLPTINITAASPFNVTLLSPADFSGTLLDGQPIQPPNVTALQINISPYAAWLKYDPGTKTLSGTPPDNIEDHAGTPLPALLTSNFNQTIRTEVYLAVVPSFFSSSNLGSIIPDPGQEVQFDLTWYFSNATESAARRSDVNLSAVFTPAAAKEYLSFDPMTAELAGKIPSQVNVTEITVSFTAYSNYTHSTSHTSLTITTSSSSGTDASNGGPNNLSVQAHNKLVLILSVVFGIIGGFLLLGITLALFRRFARTRDTAIMGKAGTQAWTAQERKWYGIDLEAGIGGHPTASGLGYGWTKDADTSGRSEKGSLEVHRTGKNQFESPHKDNAVMRKGEFLGKIKETARNVSDKYKRKADPTRRPIIGNPVLLSPTDIPRSAIDGLPVDADQDISNPASGSSPLDPRDLRPYRVSTIASFTASPSSSTGSRSIPRRRADFMPPRSPNGPREPPPAHVKDRSAQRRSMLSTSSARTHATEPFHSVVREVSLRGSRSASVLSVESHVVNAQPRLMPFTHAARVPVPRPHSGSLQTATQGEQSKRVTSQTAKVFKEGTENTLDELRIGMHYVRALGGDTRASDNGRSTSDKSFSSLESSHQGHNQTERSKEHAVSRMLVRTGERFKFRIPITSSITVSRKVEARLVSGHALPGFLQLDLKGNGGGGGEKRAVEFFGIPTELDIGEVHVGVYTIENGQCLAKVIVEVVGRS